MTTPGFDPINLDYIEMAAQECLEFVGNLSFEQFVADRKTRAATLWQICIIGETACRIDDSILQRAPEIDWQGMIGMRNLLIHEFHRIRYEVVWRAVQEDLRPLIVSIRRLRDNLNSGLH